MHYISLYKSWGFNLKNMTDGGDGVDKGTSPWNKGLKYDNLPNGKLIKQHMTKSFKNSINKIKPEVREGNYKRTILSSKQIEEIKLLYSLNLLIKRKLCDLYHIGNRSLNQILNYKQ